MLKLRRTPYRCRGCNHRFYVYLPPDRETPQGTETEAPNSAEPAQNSDMPSRPAER